MTLSEGSLACANGRDLVVLGHLHMPILRAFDAREGTLAWSSRLASFSGAPVYQGVNERGQDYVRRDRPVRWDALGAVHPVAEDHLLVQVGRGNLIQREVAVESYLLDAETGIGAFLGERLPRVAPFDGGYVALFEDPYPRLEVRAFRDSPFAMRASRLGETAQR